MKNIATASLLLLLGACGEHEHSHELKSFEIRFKAVVGDEDFVCGQTYAGLGTPASTFKPSDFRLYVHDVELAHHVGDNYPLLLDQDAQWQHDTTALLDFEDKSSTCSNGTVETNVTVRGQARIDSASGLRFKLGVPFALNHTDSATAPAPLNLSTMFWDWNGGRKFVRVEGASAALPSYLVHLGSTGCTPTGNNVTSCSHENRAAVAFDAFNPETDTVLVDLKALFATANLDVNQAMTPPGCMSGASDTDCGPLFDAMGIDLLTGAPKAGQTFFRKQ